MKKVIGILVAFTMIVSVVSAQSEDQRKKHFNVENGIANNGYDPVAYFKSSKAVKGKKELALKHLGIIYYFSSEQNKNDFKSSPDKYEPQYGGWCAYAMGAKGEKVEIDPATFKILNGKLYLFYNKYFTNTLTDWNKDESNLKSKADQNWKKFIQ